LKQELTSPPHKPALDEESFQQLLSAAHIIQEHNDKLLAREPKAGSAETLAEIVETRKLVLTGEPDLRGAAGLIVARLLRITKSSGAAIGIYDQNQLVYLAGSGSAAGESGELVAVKSSLSGACLQTGKILRRADIATGPQLPLEFRRDSTVRSLIAVPIHRENRVAGVVELRFAGINGFSEDDVYACELMAALMTEALARADELDKKEALAAEREAMLQILEKIKPQLEKLAGEPVPDLSKIDLSKIDVSKTMAPTAAAVSPTPPPNSQTAKKLAAGLEAAITPSPVAPSKPATTAGRICRGCGKEFLGEEAFCGKCGMTRTKPGGDNGHLQSKWASMWYMQQAAGQAEVKRESDKRETGKHDSGKPEIDKRESAAKLESNLEAPANGNKSHGVVAESKAPAVRSPWPTSPKPAALKKTEEVTPPAVPAAREEVSPKTFAPKENFVPRLPVSLEELVAQFAEETDLPPSAYPAVEAQPVFEPMVEAGPMPVGTTVPHDEALDWKLTPAAEIETTEHAISERNAEAEIDEAEAPEEVTDEASDYEDATLVIRNPLGGDELAEDEVGAATSTALTKTSPWTSAAHARKWLDSMRGNPRRLWLAEQWRRHHANIYLAAAGIIFVAALVGLFTQPAPVARKNPAEAQLTAFEKLMVDLGFAEAPPTPVNMGNPDRQVWVDLHTALYYCPGSDLYGKTAGGRYETQRSAQLDQFESAARRACD
jgi:GAF domain-containing protein